MNGFEGNPEHANIHAPASPDQIKTLVDIADQLTVHTWESYETDSIIMGPTGGIQLLEAFDDMNGTIAHHYNFDVIPANFGPAPDQEHDEILSIDFDPSGMGHIQPDELGFGFDDEDEDEDSRRPVEYPPRETIELARNICIDLLMEHAENGKPKLSELEQLVTLRAVSVMAGYLEQLDLQTEKTITYDGEELDMFSAISKAIAERNNNFLVTREYVHIGDNDTKLTVSRYHKTDDIKYFHLPDLEIELIDDGEDRVVALDYNNSGHALAKYYDSTEEYDDEDEDDPFADNDKFDITPTVHHYQLLLQGLNEALEHENQDIEVQERLKNFIEEFASNIYTEYLDIIEEKMTFYLQEDEEAIDREAAKLEALEAFEELKSEFESLTHVTPNLYSSASEENDTLQRLHSMEMFRNSMASVAGSEDTQSPLSLSALLKRSSMPTNGMILTIYEPGAGTMSVEQIHFLYDNLELREQVDDDGFESASVFINGYRVDGPNQFTPFSKPLRFVDSEYWSSSNN